MNKPSTIFLEFYAWDQDKTPCPPVLVEPSETECRHTPVPDGYTARSAWFEEAAKTHSQVKCPKCGLFAIWVPKAGPVEKSATISECGKYRYDLVRTWDATKPPVLFVMYNPSTADERADDPTIRRVVAFARRIGAGSVRVVNLFAFRATKPAALRAAIDPVGPENDSHIRRHAAECKIVVAAWGAIAEVGKRPLLQERPRAVLRLLDAIGAVPCRLGDLTDGGSPRHPLFLPADAPLVKWER